MTTRTLFAVFALAACTASPAPPPAPPLGTIAASMTDAVRLAEEIPRAPADRFGVDGRFRVIHTTACDTVGGNPLVWPDHSMPPAAGRPMRVLWTTTPSAPFDAAPAFLLVSVGDVEPRPFVGVGLDGCALHVSADPRNVLVFAPAPGSVLTADGGRLWFQWTPPDIFAGVEINCQLMRYSKRANAAGWLFSPGLEIWIGSGT